MNKIKLKNNPENSSFDVNEGCTADIQKESSHKPASKTVSDEPPDEEAMMNQLQDIKVRVRQEMWADDLGLNQVLRRHHRDRKQKIKHKKKKLSLKKSSIFSKNNKNRFK